MEARREAGLTSYVWPGNVCLYFYQCSCHGNGVPVGRPLCWSFSSICIVELKPSSCMDFSGANLCDTGLCLWCSVHLGAFSENCGSEMAVLRAWILVQCFESQETCASRAWKEAWFVWVCLDVRCNWLRQLWNWIDGAIILTWLISVASGSFPVDPTLLRVARLARLLRSWAKVKTRWLSAPGFVCHVVVTSHIWPLNAIVCPSEVYWKYSTPFEAWVSLQSHVHVIKTKYEVHLDESNDFGILSCFVTWRPWCLVHYHNCFARELLHFGLGFWSEIDSITLVMVSRPVFLTPATLVHP